MTCAMKRFRALATVSLLTLLYLAGCASLLWPPPSYDSRTYKSLPDLKPEVILLYKTFGGEELKAGKIEAVRLRLAQIYEYERGKGGEGVGSGRQIGII